MEKNSPHCPLVVIRRLLSAGKVRTTYSALAGGAALGLDIASMFEVIGRLTPGDFHKSMTTHADHRIWQDVYRPHTEFGRLYVKLTVTDDVLIVSFKEYQP
jgi:motility quorum-sensing regulator/GCU-specific mRNA interferase toxin